MSGKEGRLAGKRCVVTGAAQGIAWAATKAFLKEGAEVMAIDVDAEKLNSLPTLPGLTTRHLDVRDRAGVMQLAKDYQGVNVLFNCTGFVYSGTVMDITMEDWDKVFDINVKAMMHFIQAFVPQMKASGGGSVINMGSICSNVSGILMRGPYGASKAAVVGLTKGLALELIRDNIRVNVVEPGPVATESFQNRSGDAEDSDKDLIDRVEQRLMGKLPEGKDIAGLIVFLASDESWNCTGTEFLIDGGFTLTGM